MNSEIIDQIIENITFTSEELAEVGNDDVIENWDSVVEMLEYLKEVKERDERQKRLLLEMKDDFARENYVIHLYQRVGKNGIEE